MIRDQSRSTAALTGGPTDNIGHPVWPGSARDGSSAVLGCPLCRRPIPRPGACPDGSTPLAECIPCDLYFDAGDGEACFRSHDPG